MEKYHMRRKDRQKERSLKNDEVYNNIAIMRLDIKYLTGKKGR